MIGLFGDGSVGNPSVPVQIGGTMAHRPDGQDAAWQALVLMLGLVLIMGSAVVVYVVVQRARLLARRRARAALAVHGTSDGGDGGDDGDTDTGTAQYRTVEHGEAGLESAQWSAAEPAAVPEPGFPDHEPPEPAHADPDAIADVPGNAHPRQGRRPRVTA